VLPVEILLPRADGTLDSYTPVGEPVAVAPAAPSSSRVAYAAAHVVCDPLADNDPTLDVDLDWEATLSYRRYLWSLGLSVAEAMDTAQRGMGLGWETSRELIRRSIAEAREVGGDIASGAGTDHLDPTDVATLSEIKSAYEEQCALVEGVGGRVILMASRALAARAESPEDRLPGIHQRPPGPLSNGRGQEGARSVTHLSELFVLADRAGLLHDPDLALERMGRVLSVAGVA
jgi:hypothetical protein